MAQMTPQVSELLEKALTLSTQERGLLIDRLVETLDNDPAEAGAEAAWNEEIKRRIDDIRSGRVKTIPGEQVLREMAEEFPDGEQAGSLPSRGPRGIQHRDSLGIEIRIHWYRRFRLAVSGSIRQIVQAPQHWPKYLAGGPPQNDVCLRYSPRGCPILALFARVGGDAVATQLHLRGRSPVSTSRKKARQRCLLYFADHRTAYSAQQRDGAP